MLTPAYLQIFDAISHLTHGVKFLVDLRKDLIVS